MPSGAQSRLETQETIGGIICGMLSPDLERSLLHLPMQDRARLAQILLESLDQLPQQEVRQLWIEEARRRAEEIDQGKVQMVSGEELERQVQELFK
jgi:putative addiction module component (TIGR02574 family)